MKAEERKHLQANTLVEGLGKLSQGLQQGLPRSVWLLLGAVVLVVVLFWIWRHFSERSQRLNAALWYEFGKLDGVESMDNFVKDLSKEEQANLLSNKEKYDLERLEKFVKDNAGTVQGRLARFQLARLYLYKGLRDLGREGTVRNLARERLEKAAETYDVLIKEARDIPVLHQEAMLNCGKAQESLGDLTRANKYYKQLQDTYPKSEFGKLAGEQIKRLETHQNEITQLVKDLKEVPTPPVHP